MYSFKNDYSEGAHPRIINALMTSNTVQREGYGEDIYTQEAIELLKKRIGRNDIDIHLLTGGTQTNLTVISAFLRSHEAVISANTGHVLTHETGAIESTGHKVISVDVMDGKLSPHHISSAIKLHTDEHMVKPKLVYISNPTEIGTIYNRNELDDLNKICQEYGLILYMDGARLGSALSSTDNDLDLSDLARLTDAFYIGGTKNGALLGEALVICKESLKEDFRFIIKQKGALLAKGSLLGIQFLELFRDNLYFELAFHANKMADMIRDDIRKAGFAFLTDSPTNQIFPILPNSLIQKLLVNYSFYIWKEIDDNNSAVRLVTSWATKEEYVKAFLKDLKDCINKGTE